MGGLILAVATALAENAPGEFGKEEVGCKLKMLNGYMVTRLAAR